MEPPQNYTFTIQNLDDCKRLAEAIAQVASSPLTIELIGTLGAGKTQWSRFFVEAFGGDPTEVSSPTFVLVKKYHGKQLIYHMDLYRLRDEDELLEIGFEEMLDEEAIVLIEWADRFPDVMPREKLRIELSVAPEDHSRRQVSITANGAIPHAILDAVKENF